jgi:hypothetical protein
MIKTTDKTANFHLEPFQIQNPLLHSFQKATEQHQFSLLKKTPKSTEAHSAKPCPNHKHK